MRDMATAFHDQDPDGNGKDDTVGYYMMLWPGVSNLLTAITWWSAAGFDDNRYGDSPEPIFNNPGQREVIAEMRDWVHKYKNVNADALGVSAGNLYDAMNAGRVGIGRLGNWNVNRFDSNIDADYVPFLFPPKTQGQTAPNYAPYFQHAIALVRDSDHKAEALEYMKVFIGKEAQELRYEAIGAVARTDLDFDALEDNQGASSSWTRRWPRPRIGRRIRGLPSIARYCRLRWTRSLRIRTSISSRSSAQPSTKS